MNLERDSFIYQILDLPRNEDIIIDSQGSIRYGFLKLNYAKMLQEWVKDIPQVSVNNTQIRVKNEYLQDIRLNSQEIELELY